jgi:HK97 family phage major capsid protein
MKTAQQLRDLIATTQETMSASHAKAAAEQRSFSPDELSAWEKANQEVQSLKRELGIVETQEKIDAELAASRGQKLNNQNNKEDKDLGKYSVLRALNALVEGRSADGLEGEMHQEAQKEARAMGETIQGIGIPQSVLLHRQKRDNSITMPTQPEDGSAVMLQNQYYGSMMDMLRNALVTRQLGCTFLNDLTGNLSFTSMTTRPTATWKPEVGDLDKSNAKFAVEDFAPKRLGTYLVQSKLFLRQTAPSIEQKIREEIIYSITEGVDVAAIVGTGASNQPTGILNIAGTNAIALGANGAALTRANLVAAETTIAALNLNTTNYAWLINAATRGKLKNTLLDAGSGRFLMESNSSLLEYPVVMSNVAPSNLTKGTASGVASAAVFGDWSELFIGQWGGIDLMVDPYTLAVGGQVKIIAQGFFNIYIRRPSAFVKFTDILTT